MSEDTSSSPRQEWYEEYPEPDEPKQQILQGSWAGLTTVPPPPSSLKPGDLFRNKNGDLIGIVQSFDAATGQVTLMTSGYVTRARSAGKTIHAIIEASAKAYIEAAQKILDAVKDMASDRPNEAESVRDRALRLAKQPHSMAQDPCDFHFDRRGRRRY